MELITKMKKLIHLLDDRTRLQIVLSLIDESRCACGCEHCESCSHLCCMIEMCVNDIVKKVNAEQSLISHQLFTLKEGNILRTRREGKYVYYSLCDGHVKQILQLVKAHVLED